MILQRSIPLHIRPRAETAAGQRIRQVRAHPPSSDTTLHVRPSLPYLGDLSLTTTKHDTKTERTRRAVVTLISRCEIAGELGGIAHGDPTLSLLFLQTQVGEAAVAIQ